jgi:uncharacterized protein (UPF0248 family)
MIKVEEIDVWGFKHAIRGMRNPMNSWDKSDSGWEWVEDPSPINPNDPGMQFVVGQNDLGLMRKLYKAGSEHRKYLRQIFVSMDITAPLYWWKEMDQYRINITTNSCSTMHRLLSKPFEMEDFSFDKLPGYKVNVKQFVPELDEEMLASEVWVFYDNDYDVSCYGRVKHKFKNHYRLLGGSKHKDGYIYVTLHGKQIPLHRIVAKLFHSQDYKDGLVVNHIDGNKQNNFADNLEWVTQSDNIKHSYENSLQPKTVSTYKGKFTQEERAYIRQLWEDGVLSKREIAKKYNVSHTCINDIINDKYKYADSVNVYEEIARPWIDTLNELRDAWFNEEDTDKKKHIWYAIIQLLPSSYNQKRTITMNYENVMNIIHQRTGHKLDEWREFVNVLKDLPYVKEIMEDEDGNS